VKIILGTRLFAMYLLFSILCAFITGIVTDVIIGTEDRVRPVLAITSTREMFPSLQGLSVPPFWASAG
jgi:uncharacterized membrane-anchored protein YitT (DUF2179 family)